jgi:surface-anchored protein
VWVVPQTENPGVVWLGWNTQDPAVMERIDRGVRLRLLGADGPGKLSVYLQSGDLSGPEVLWESDAEVTDPLWVDVNTHTHANWVFSAPGVYVVRLEATADLLDGSKVSDVADVRVAVGDATQIGEAAAVFEVDEAASSAPVDGDEASAAADPESVVESSGGRTALVAAVVVAAGVLAVSVAVGVARARAARRRLVGGGRS